MSEKICHLHLQCSMGNKSTLICYLNEGSIEYRYYSGWSSTGTPLSLSNLQIGYRYGGSYLPVENEYEETKSQFTDRIISMINEDSVKKVVHSVNTEVKFA